MNKIPLPPLPDPYASVGTVAEAMRALQLETAKAVQEACVRVCEEWEKQNWVYRNGAIQCVKATRALEFDV